MVGLSARYPGWARGGEEEEGEEGREGEEGAVMGKYEIEAVRSEFRESRHGI